MPLPISQETSKLINETEKYIEQRVLSGESDLPVNVQQRVAENALYKYYQQQQQERLRQSRAARNAVSSSKGFLNGIAVDQG